MQNSVSMKISRNNILIKGPVPLFNPARKSATRCNVYTFVFCIFTVVCFTCIRSSKISWSGKLLNFTEIHRKYYKKLSFSFGTNLSHALWFEKFRIWFSSPRTTRGTTLLYIQGTIVIFCCCINIIFVRLLKLEYIYF